jgi:hypothetical protein
MGDHIIKTGDQVRVTIAPPTVVPAIALPVPLVGSGRTVAVGGAPICLEGDELPKPLRAVLPYTAPPFTNPGTGRLSLTLLPGNKTQLSENGKPILIKGPTFTATFDVVTPATQTTPSGPVPDGQLTKRGTAQFITTNQTVQAG